MPSYVEGAFKQKSEQQLLKSLEQEIFLLQQFFLVAKINMTKFFNSIMLLLNAVRSWLTRNTLSYHKFKYLN